MPELVREGWKKFVVYDPTARDTRANATIFGSPRVETPEEYFSTASGKKRRQRAENRIVVPLREFDEVEQLKTFAADETDVNGILLGFDRHIQFYEDVFLQLRTGRVARGVNSGDLVELYTSKLNAAVHHHINLLWYNGWADGDSDGFADGWNTNNLDSGTFSDPEQQVTLSISGATNARFRLDTDFPIPDETLRFVVNVTELHSVADTKLIIRNRNAAGTSTSSSEVTVSSTGVASVEHTTESDTVEVRVLLRWENGDGTSDTVKFENPTLRTNQFDQVIRA